MCCCIGFCLCTKKLNSKHYSIIAIVCNIINIAIAITRICLFGLSVTIFLVSNLVDVILTITNLVFMIIILIHILKGSAFDKFNKTAKTLCVISMVFSGILLFFLILFIIGVIIIINAFNNLFKGTSTREWFIILIILIFCLVLEILESLAYNYLYRLLKLKTNSNFDEYLKNIQNIISQDSVTNTQIYQNQNDVVITTSPQIQQKLDSNYEIKA
jgi:hypothetical protein